MAPQKTPCLRVTTHDSMYQSMTPRITPFLDSTENPDSAYDPIGSACDLILTPHIQNVNFEIKMDSQIRFFEQVTDRGREPQYHYSVNYRRKPISSAPIHFYSSRTNTDLRTSHQPCLINSSRVKSAPAQHTSTLLREQFRLHSHERPDTPGDLSLLRGLAPGTASF